MLNPDHSIQGGNQTLDLDQGTYVDLHGALWSHGFNHTAQAGLDFSELKTSFPVIPVCTHAQKRIFAERNSDTLT